jgi:hypothetical protein
VDFHLKRGLRLQTEPAYKNLYTWAIFEVDAQGQQIGPDQIPWSWTLYFTATSCALYDSIEIRSQDRLDETTLAVPEIEQRQVTRVALQPAKENRDSFRGTRFSMFGTDRIIKSFQLDIHPIAKPAEQERCTAWLGVLHARTRLQGRDNG